MAKLRTCFLICKMRAFDRMITEILPPQKFHNIMVINTLRMGRGEAFLLPPILNVS